MALLNLIVDQLQAAIKNRNINEILSIKRYDTHDDNLIDSYNLNNALNRMDENDYYFLQDVLYIWRNNNDLSRTVVKYRDILCNHLDAKRKHKISIIYRDHYFKPTLPLFCHQLTGGNVVYGYGFDPRINEIRINDIYIIIPNSYDRVIIFIFNAIKLVINTRYSNNFDRYRAQISRRCYALCRNTRENIKQEIAVKMI